MVSASKTKTSLVKSKYKDVVSESITEPPLVKYFDINLAWLSLNNSLASILSFCLQFLGKYPVIPFMLHFTKSSYCTENGAACSRTQGASCCS